MTAPVEWNYDPQELRADGLVHVISVTFAAIGAAAVVVLALRAAPSMLFGVGVYAICLVVTLTISALYNMWPVGPRKWLLRRLDHAGIFLLIAGTYTPFALQFDAFGRNFMIGVWCFATLGMLYKIALPGRFDKFAVLVYLGLGWSGLFLFRQMTLDLAPLAVTLILFGGLVYSSGVVFHLKGSLRFQNAIWHAFVLAGAACHYAAVLVTIF
ncbi:MAG TPA: hemolysin III family protein, partial [Pararhizobium sp.]|nr:hemolysin III family protein [Pararhizobium sp.]